MIREIAENDFNGLLSFYMQLKSELATDCNCEALYNPNDKSGFKEDIR